MRGLARTAMVVLFLLGLVGGAMAQQLRGFHGRVLYVAGTTMAFAPDVGRSFDVDLSQIDQTAYEFRNSGDAVTVVGVVTAHGNRLIAASRTTDR